MKYNCMLFYLVFVISVWINDGISFVYVSSDLSSKFNENNVILDEESGSCPIRTSTDLSHKKNGNENQTFPITRTFGTTSDRTNASWLLFQKLVQIQQLILETSWIDLYEGIVRPIAVVLILGTLLFHVGMYMKRKLNRPTVGDMHNDAIQLLLLLESKTECETDDDWYSENNRTRTIHKSRPMDMTNSTERSIGRSNKQIIIQQQQQRQQYQQTRRNKMNNFISFLWDGVFGSNHDNGIHSDTFHSKKDLETKAISWLYQASDRMYYPATLTLAAYYTYRMDQPQKAIELLHHTILINSNDACTDTTNLSFSSTNTMHQQQQRQYSPTTTTYRRCSSSNTSSTTMIPRNHDDKLRHSYILDAKRILYDAKVILSGERSSMIQSVLREDDYLSIHFAQESAAIWFRQLKKEKNPHLTN